MKYILLLTVVIMASNHSKAQTKNCLRVHEGTFKLTSEQGTTIIKRTKTKQIETDPKIKFKATYDVVWLDDCTYQLRKPKLISGDPRLAGNSSSVLTVKIIEVKAKSYVVRTSANFTDMVLEREIEIIK
jgi:hypothetical protein